MERAKIAIYFCDIEYLERFIRCWMHHFKRDYEVNVFTSLEDMIRQKTDYEIAMVEGIDVEELSFMCSDNIKVFYLSEGDSFACENAIVLDKYQEIYKVEQQVKRYASERNAGPQRISQHRKLVGVFSVDEEGYQIPFCAMLVSEYAKGRSCVLLNLQMASGLEAEKELGMEELLVAAATNSYTKAQIYDAIVQECEWDYVCPVKNSQYLVETNIDLYKSLLDILEKEMGYDTYIINFGQMFRGCMELMNMCEDFYLLVSREAYKTRREKAFVQELNHYGLERMLEKIVRVEISGTYNAYESWRNLAEKWRWNEVGDQIRKNVLGG